MVTPFIITVLGPLLAGVWATVACLKVKTLFETPFDQLVYAGKYVELVFTVAPVIFIPDGNEVPLPSAFGVNFIVMHITELVVILLAVKV